MALEWLQMRITEEKDRREREAMVLSRLPGAMEELHHDLTECVLAYTEAFGREAAEVEFHEGKIRVVSRDEKDGRWEPMAAVEVTLILKPQGFRVEHTAKEPMLIEIGLLPTGRLYYRQDEKYLTLDEMTRRILDCVLFPKLAE